MSELQKSLQEKSLEELIKILERQEEMTSLLEHLQSLNESLEQELSEAKATILEKEEELDELMQLNSSLNNENSRLQAQIKELMNLKE